MAEPCVSSGCFIVRMLMMLVVRVTMFVGSGFVCVLMCMILGQMQPYAQRHEGRSQPEMPCC